MKRYNVPRTPEEEEEEEGLKEELLRAFAAVSKSDPSLSQVTPGQENKKRLMGLTVICIRVSVIYLPYSASYPTSTISNPPSLTFYLPPRRGELRVASFATHITTPCSQNAKQIVERQQRLTPDFTHHGYQPLFSIAFAILEFFSFLLFYFYTISMYRVTCK